MADKWMFIIVVMLMGLGLVFSYSLPIYIETKYGWSEFHFFIRFFVFSLMGLGIIFGLAQCNPDKCISKIGWSLLIVGGILLFLMATPLLAPYCPTIKGAKRWIGIGLVRISPLEFFKIGMIYFFAWSFSRKLLPQKFPTLKEEIKVLLPYLAVLFLVAGFVIIYQSDLGETLLIFMIFYFMLTFTQLSAKVFGVLMGAGIVVFVFGVLEGGYRANRIKTMLYNIYLMLPKTMQSWFDVQISSYDLSYQLRQGINAIHNGGIFGVGVGNGAFKMGFLSDVHTDFVLAGISEEIGFLGVLAVVILMLLLIWRILKVANRIEVKTNQDNVYKLFTVGIAILFSLETILNAMGIIGFLPLKGLPIPFVSYGGSAMISFSVAIGMVLMISKKAKM